MQKDWMADLIIRLPRKSILTEYSRNLRGITLMLVAAKILGKVIITKVRPRDTTDIKIRKEEAS